MVGNRCQSIKSARLFLGPKQVDNGGNNGNYSGTDYDAKRDEYSLIFTGKIPRTLRFLEQSICKISLGLETQIQPPKRLATLQTSIAAARFTIR